MHFKQYENLAMKTNGCGQNIFYLISSLAGETGELLDALKKGIFHGHGIDKDNCIKEVGDILWSLAYAINIIADSSDGVINKTTICQSFTGVIGNEIIKKHFPTSNTVGYATMPNHVPLATNKMNAETHENNLNAELMKFIVTLPQLVGEASEAVISTCEITTKQPAPYAVDEIVEKFNDKKIRGNKITIFCKLQRILALLTWLCHNVLDSSIEVAMERNIVKLQKRYNGAFSTEKSIKRVDTK